MKTLTLPLILLAFLSGNPVFAQGFSPQEAASKMTVPEGFTVNLYASEPQVRQPVAIEFDDRGRLWVTQYLQYPNPSGLERVSVDRWSRTVYDRIPEPPPHGPKGADKITILEDTDRDGVFDSAKDFVEGLNLASGLAFGHGGVFVLQVPYLLFYPDHDRDDVPDSDPKVCLTGFGMQDAHSVANSLTWGPDGWLYGLQGSTVSANIRGIEFQQGVWRYHPLTEEFELFCEGGGNMWGLDFTPEGHLIACTNVGPALGLHAAQGAYYWKSFSKHGDLHNPYAYGFFDHMVEPSYKGGHVNVGGMFYYGGSFPPEYRGKFITANLLSHDVYEHVISPLGSTFQADHAGELLFSNDTWFAPTDLTIGPDGAVYVTDWHDERTAHPDPDAEWDRSNGRIVRIAAKGTEIPAPFDLSKKTSDELVDLLGHENNWFARRARALLAERQDSSVFEKLKSRALDPKTEPQLAFETFWALHNSGGFNAEVAERGLSHPLAPIRYWTVRYLGNPNKVSPAMGEALVILAKDEPSPTVRAQLASTAKRIQSEYAIPAIEGLLTHSEDVSDLHIPLLLWWTVEAHSISSRQDILDRFANAEGWANPLLAGTILPRLVRRYAAEATPEGDAACGVLLDAAPNDNIRSNLIGELDKGLADRHKTLSNAGSGGLFASVSEADSGTGGTHAPPALSEGLEKRVVDHWQRHPEEMAVLSIVARLGVEQAMVQVREGVSDSTLPAERRIEQVRILGQLSDPVDEVLLAGIVSGTTHEDLAIAAIEALRALEKPETLATLLESYSQLPDRVRSRLRDVLFARPSSAMEFLRRVEAGAIAPEDVPVEQLRVIALHQDKELDQLVKDHWGSVSRGTPEEKLAEMRRHNNDLNWGKGDPVAGHKVFTEVCASCHRMNGEGQEIGPDLTHSNRTDREFLLVSMVDPSFVIRKEFLQHIIETFDGGLYTGIIVDRSAEGIVLVGQNNERTTLAEEDIFEMRESQVSLMPEGVLQPLDSDQVRDLFAFLQETSVEKE
jgi:putative membrane-bound dehydrogenase-like protein